MNNRIITDITNFIFVSDEPEKVDAIFLPGGSHPEQPEYAAELYHKGYAKWLIPSGGISVKCDKWPGVRSKADIYNGNYNSDCEFFTDVFRKNGVPASAIIGEDKSGHTRDNAFLSRKVVDERGIDKNTGKVLVEVDPRYFRPTEVDLLLGDSSKARRELGWTPKYDLPALIKEMVREDMKEAQKENFLKNEGYEILIPQEA